MTLTDTQRRVIEFLRTFSAQKGFMPTRAEIADNFGWNSPNAAHEHLLALKRKGAITLGRGTARSMGITPEGLASFGTPALPSLLDTGRFMALPVVDPTKVGTTWRAGA